MILMKDKKKSIKYMCVSEYVQNKSGKNNQNIEDCKRKQKKEKEKRNSFKKIKNESNIIQINEQVK